MNSEARKNTVLVALVAAIVVPRVERATGVKLTIDDVAALMALSVVVWHGAASVFERYFPPPVSPKPTPIGESK